ncbi:ketosamine-3-kinase-like isoform X2 [Clavelina lepadiformis]|uniref:protein-ribulosamine 3-kinase n=1 Tax=Clavelina lepadiformis TaxID=159417 RepID=A0ABP0G2A2_CLALP
MYEGELASLTKLQQTNIIKVPKPIKIINRGEMSFFVLEYLLINPLRKQAASFGKQLAQLHLYNDKLRVHVAKTRSFVGESTEYVDKFGFDVTTSCGFIPMNNEWEADWLTFFARNRLKPQIDMIVSTYHNRDMLTLWPELERILPNVFPKNLNISPSLLHGDIWGNNVGEVSNEPCLFDPASFYGHSEFDLALMHLIGGFPAEFYEAYHNLMTKQPGLENRLKAYMLFYLLNRWNHYGSGYKASSIALMKEICNLFCV